MVNYAINHLCDDGNYEMNEDCIAINLTLP